MRMQCVKKKVASSKMDTYNNYRTIWLSTHSMDKNTAQVEDTFLKNRQTNNSRPIR